MGKIVVLCLLCFPLFAQQRWEIVKVDSVFTTKMASEKPAVFGGISAIEPLGNKEFLLVSDRQEPSPAPNKQFSWIYRYKDGKITLDKPFFGIKNVESVRFHKQSAQFWFSYESDEESGIGYINAHQKAKIVRKYSMITSPHTSLNRGIEGLVAGTDLWYSFEAGLDSTMLVRWKGFNPKNETWYKYPLDRKACLGPEVPPGSRLGNGISEILHVPGEEDKLLVLERCFDGKISPIYLYEVDFSKSPLERKLVFSWDASTTFDGKQVRPDNFEGICWGVEGDTLMMVADDNHNPRFQRTLIVTLQKIK